MPPKSSYAVQWNGKSMQTTKYFDSLGNVKLNYDISEAFLWNWTPLWIFWKCGFFILILDANKHWNIWNIHGMSNDFGQLYSVISLGTECVLMIHMISQDMSYNFAVSVVPWAKWNWWISLILAWPAMILCKPVLFAFFPLSKCIRFCLVRTVKYSCLLKVVCRVEIMIYVTLRELQCEAVIWMPELSVDSLLPQMITHCMEWRADLLLTIKNATIYWLCRSAW